MPDKTQKKGVSVPKKKQDQPPPKESNLIWFGLGLIAIAGIIIWLANTLGPGGKGMSDDMLVRKTIRDQYDALFARDADGNPLPEKEKFLDFYSKDFFNGDNTYDDKVKQLEELDKTHFQVKDFTLEFIESGTGDAKTEVHVDLPRNFASTYVYTYWRQRGGGSITLKPVEQLSAFLLRKEGDRWRIISEKSIALQKKEDAEQLIGITQLKPFMDPSTIVWPPPKNVKEETPP